MFGAFLASLVPAGIAILAKSVQTECNEAKEQREQWRKLAFRHCRAASEFEELNLASIAEVQPEFAFGKVNSFQLL